MTNAEIIAAIEGMTILELADLVKEMEEKFGVSAAAPVVAGGAVAAAAEAVEEKTEFDVILKEAGAKKLTIKCGVCDGDFLDENGVKALADLPSKEVLIAKIMGSMMSAVSKFVYVVEAIRKQKAGEE